jgi:type I restriction enzyme S subunit
MKKMHTSWEEIEIKKIAEVKTGGTPSRRKKEYWENGTIPWINSGKLKDDIISTPSEHITKKGLDNSSCRLFPKNTVVIALTGATTGKTGILDFECSTNQSVTGIYPSDRHDPFFLFSYFRYARKKILHQTVGSAQPHINQKIVEEFKIPLPELSIQKQASLILKKIWHSIEYQKKMLESYRHLTISNFISLFGDPITNPKNWNVIPMSDIITHAQYGLSSALNETKGIPCLRMGNLTDEGDIVLDDLKYYNGDDAEKYLLKKGNILFNRTNSRKLVGKTAIFDLDKKITFAGYLIRLETNQKKCNPYFLSMYMNLPIIKDKIHRMAQGSIGQANINATKIQELEIYLPPISIQNNFENIIRKINSNYQKEVMLNQKMIELSNSLHYQIFTLNKV